MTKLDSTSQQLPASSSSQLKVQAQPAPTPNVFITDAQRNELARVTRGLLNDNRFSRGALTADTTLETMVRPHLAQPNAQVAALKANTGVWSPVLTQDAVLPIALMAMHHLFYYLMSQKANALNIAAKTSLGRSLAGQMALYIGEWALAEVFRLAADPAMARWQNKAGEKVTDYATRVNKNDMTSWAVNSVRDEINAAVGSRAAEDTRAAVHNLSDTLDNLMGLTVAAMPLMMGVGVGFGTMSLASVATLASASLPNLVGAVAGTVMLYSRSGEQSRLTIAEHQAETTVRELTRNYADNVMIPNSLNQRLYERDLAVAVAERDRCTKKRSDYKFKSEVMLTLLNGVCLMGLHAFKVDGMQNVNMTDSQFKMLPAKLLQLNKISHRSIALGNDVTTLMQNWDNLKSLKSSIDTLRPEDWKNRLTQMFANREHFIINDSLGRRHTVAEMLSQTDQLKRPGRWTIRARNGSGKSTLANAIVAAMGGAAHYIPVKHELYHEAPKGSAAETQIGQLAEVFEKVTAQTLVLDEWPANLDVNNTQRVNGILDDASRRFCIIEIRND